MSEFQIADVDGHGHPLTRQFYPSAVRGDHGCDPPDLGNGIAVRLDPGLRSRCGAAQRVALGCADCHGLDLRLLDRQAAQAARTPMRIRKDAAQDLRLAGADARGLRAAGDGGPNGALPQELAPLLLLRCPLPVGNGIKFRQFGHLGQHGGGMVRDQGGHPGGLPAAPEAFLRVEHAVVQVLDLGDGDRADQGAGVRIGGGGRVRCAGDQVDQETGVAALVEHRLGRAVSADDIRAAIRVVVVQAAGRTTFTRLLGADLHRCLGDQIANTIAQAFSFRRWDPGFPPRGAVIARARPHPAVQRTIQAGQGDPADTAAQPAQVMLVGDASNVHLGLVTIPVSVLARGLGVERLHHRRPGQQQEARILGMVAGAVTILLALQQATAQHGGHAAVDRADASQGPVQFLRALLLGGFCAQPAGVLGQDQGRQVQPGQAGGAGGVVQQASLAASALLRQGAGVGRKAPTDPVHEILVLERSGEFNLLAFAPVRRV
ncbi:MAG TPA: hypothetical protein VGE72_17070 [Azospirillum sp.]